MLRFAKVLRTRLGASARTLLVQLRGLGSTGDDDQAEALDDVEVMQPFGLFSRPPLATSLEALIAEIGEEVIALVLGNKGASALDVEEGETRLYGAKESDARVRLRASGAVNVESKAATDITLNGGTKSVARVDDTVNCGTLALTAATVGPNVVVTLTYVPPSGPPQVSSFSLAIATLAATVPLTQSLAGVVTSGAARVKA
jgi:phage gp45-like